MTDKESPQSVIDAYKKRQKMMPILIRGLAILLVVVGVIILVVWFTSSDGPKLSIFASATPTATNTATPTPVTPTSTPTLTSTVTNTPTMTNTPTPSGPFEYTVQEDDNCWGISQQFEVDLVVLLALNNFGSTCPINPGDKILIPAPGQELPTETPIPTDLPRGTKITYVVKSGETLDVIASRFNTTVEDIMLQNELENANEIFAGQELIVRVYLVTPTLTTAPTSTSAVTATTSPNTTTTPAQ